MTSDKQPIRVERPSTFARMRCSALLALALLGLAGGCGDDSSGKGDDMQADAGVCTPGSKGCECAAGNVCDDGLACDDDVCGGGVSLPPVAFPNSARSCEILLVEGDTDVIGIEFGDNTTGAFIREEPRIGVALHANSDAPMGDLVVKLASDGEAPKAKLVTCFDADGETLDDVELGIGG